MFANATAFDQDLGGWDVDKVTDMSFMFYKVTLSTANYDALLRGWSALSLQRGVSFGGGDSKYCDESARTILVDTHSWSITDGGEDTELYCTKAHQVSFAFASTSITKSFGDAAFTATPTGGSGAGVLTYLSTDPTVATIAPFTGEVTIVGVGTTTITATKAGDTTYNPATTRYTLNIDNANAFVTTWEVVAGGLGIRIPTNGDFAYRYTVDWGDNSADTRVYTGDATHTYSTAGSYTVSIAGTFPSIYFDSIRFNGQFDLTNSRKIKTIKQWGDNPWKSMNRAFYYCRNLTIEATAGTPDLSNVTDMSLMFYRARVFNQDLSRWDVSKVTDMFGMFVGATAFNRDLSKWDVSKVTDMSGMFSGAVAFNQDISRWDVSKVTDMDDMFSGVTLSIANYDALLIGWSALPTLQRDVEFGGGYSKYCNESARNRLVNTYNWDIRDGGKDLDGNCPLIDQEVFAFASTSLTKSTGDAAFTITPTGGSGTGGITYQSSDTSVATIAADSGEVTIAGVGTTTITATKAGDTTYHPATASYTLTIDNDNAIDYSNAFVTTWEVTAGSLGITIPTNSDFVYGYTVDWGDSSADTTIYTGDATHAYTTDGIYTVSIAGTFPSIYFNAADFGSINSLKIKTIKQWGDNPWKSMSRAFQGCINLTIEAAAGNPDLSNVTDMSSMFRYAAAFNRALIEWDVSNVMDMSEMFYGATVFDQDLSGWDVGKVSTMSNMFSGVTLSTENYDALLRGWSTLTLQRGVPFGGGNSKYCDESARSALVTTHNWGITDGGKDLDENCARSQAVFAFASPRITKIFGDAAFTFTATGGSGTGGITYLSTNPGVATIDTDNGEVTIAGVGTTTITATKAAEADYNEATASYTLSVAKSDQAAFAFANAVVDKIFGDVFIIAPIGGPGTGTITYESSVTTVATIAGTSGEITIKAPGTTTITATKAADTNYNGATASYTLNVAKAEQAIFSFATATVNKIVGDPAFTEAVSGGSGNGAVTYASGDTGVGVASVNADSGEVTILAVGTSTITATKAADDNYNVATASYTLIVTVTRVPPTFGSVSIVEQDYTVGTAVNVTLPAATAGTALLSYSLTPGTDIPDGLTFTALDRRLAGTPTTAAAAITLTYTVTDSTTPTPTTAFQTFTVTVAKGEQASFSFATATVNKIVGDPAFTEAVSGGSGNGAVTYASGDTGVASVNADSGEVTILVFGTSTITATKAADDNYNVATASYTLIVTATLVPLALGTGPIAPQAYTVDLVVDVTLPAATGGMAPFSYSLTPGTDIPDGLTFTALDRLRLLAGTPTTAAETITLTYTVTDSTTPTPATAFQTFTVTVAKGEQAIFSFATATVNKIVGDLAFIEAASGGSGDGAVTYASGDTTVASVNADSGEVTILAVGTAIITATKAADTNYYEAIASYTLTVVGLTLTPSTLTLNEGCHHRLYRDSRHSAHGHGDGDDCQ